MSRSGEKARRRLQQAALELYGERGYDQTTTAEIAARAGVTERTFFRHFPDKREVLFDGEATLKSALNRAVADAPDSLGPLEVIMRAFQSIEKTLEDNRSFAEPRYKVITSTPALHERALAKGASVTATLVSALRQRGVADRVAALAAQAGMALFSHALTSWRDDPSTGLEEHLRHALDELHALSSAHSAQESRDPASSRRRRS